MMPIERMRPEDFDAVFRLLSQSFPAGERRDAPEYQVTSEPDFFGAPGSARVIVW